MALADTCKGDGYDACRDGRRSCCRRRACLDEGPDVHCEMATVSKKVDALKVMKGLPKEALALITELERAQSRAKQAARDATRALAVAAEKMPNKVCDVRACAAALSTSAHMLASGAGAAATNAVEENVQGMRRQYGLEAYGSWGLEESHDGEVAARCVAQQFM